MCTCVFVCELTGSFSLALDVNRKRRGVFQDIWEFLIRRTLHSVFVDHCWESFLDAEAVSSWTLRKRLYSQITVVPPQ